MLKIFIICIILINSYSAYTETLGIETGLKIPRLLEACSDFPAVYPIGKNSYDFYHQCHFGYLLEL